MTVPILDYDSDPPRKNLFLHEPILCHRRRANNSLRESRLDYPIAIGSGLTNLSNICSFVCSRCSTIEPDRHAWLEAGRITLQIEAQAQSIAVVTANRTLGLPCRERAQRAHLGDQSGRLLRHA